MSKYLKGLLGLFFIVVSVVLLASCGGGGGSSSGVTSQTTPAPTPGPPPTGTVGVFLTDAPSDNFAAILLTITSVELLGDAGKVEIFSGSKTVDLLMLQNFYDMLALNGNVPAGFYSKIRLYLDDIELLVKDDDGNIIDSVHPDLPANGKLDLNPRDAFEVREGHAVMIEIDFDAEKSIHIVETGNGDYKFRPVVFVDIVETVITDGFVRVHGVIDDIAFDRFFFQLCEVDVFVHHDDDFCLVVNVFGDVAIFDENGNAIDFMDLEVGDEATVIGFATVVDDPVMADHDSDTDSDSDSDSDGDTDSDSDSDSDSDCDADSDTDSDSDCDSGPGFPPQIQIDAIAILLGPDGNYIQLNGTALSGVDEGTGVFDFQIAPGQGFGEGSRVDAVIMDSTRIFNSEFEEIDESAISLGTAATVEGMLMLSDIDPDMLKAALILIREEGTDLAQLSGEIIDIDPDTRSFLISVEGDERCVEMAKENHIFLITEGEDGAVSEEILFEDLKIGFLTANFGEFDDDPCFDASIVIAFASE